MKSFCKIYSVLVVLLCPAISFGQSHEITLDSAKSAALNYSYNIKNNQLNTQSAYLDKISVESSRLPDVSVGGMLIYGIKDFVKPVPPLLNKGIGNFYFAGVSAMEPIYMGGKIQTGIELAKLQIEVEKIREKQTSDSVLLLTEQKYWRLVQLQEQIKVLKANEILVDGILKQMQDMLASGLIARNDLLKVKVRRSEVLLNESKLSNGHKLAIFDFCLYIGLPYDSSLVATDTLANAKPASALFVSPEQALLQNQDVHLLQRNLEVQQLQKKLTKADYLPTISAGVNAGQFGSIGHSDINNFMPVAFGTVSIPISGLIWGSGKSKMKQQAIKEEIAKNTLVDGQRRIQTGILKSWYDMDDAYQQIVFAKENLVQATENLKVNRDNYSSGLISITELLDAQASYQQASSSIVDAYAQYRSKMASYLYVTGKMDTTTPIQQP